LAGQGSLTGGRIGMRGGEMVVQPGHLQHQVEKCRAVVEMQLNARLGDAAVEQKLSPMLIFRICDRAALATVNSTYDGGVMTGQIPLVDYLVLDDGDPHLVAQECTNCNARFFDRRNACASCFASEFSSVAVATEGTLRAFTIVTFAAPGIPTPFVASVVDCDGTQVRANLVNVEPDPEHVRDGMKVRLATYSIGTDSAGTEAIGFGFEPAT
jgi:uncharacterized OB-fold protein